MSFLSATGGGGVDASGGTTVTTFTDNTGTEYQIHAFENVGSDTFTVNEGGEVDVLIVAGGGSGGVDNGGGGGGGGVIDRNISISPGNYTISVGDGGDARPGGADHGRGNPGEDTSGFGLTALGGGVGTGWDMDNNSNPSSQPLDGGSGGGQGASNDGVHPSGVGQGLQPNSAGGGLGNDGGSGITNYGGGGGGAGSSGTDGNSSVGGTGAEPLELNGKYSNVVPTDSVGAGGTGGWNDSQGFSVSNSPISNNGVPKRGNTQADEQPSPPNTGHGGHGGNTNNQTSGAGGSGIVVIRYEI